MEGKERRKSCGALEKHPWIEEFCRQFPGDILYGEVFGNVQSLKYGARPNDVFFRAFDVMHGSEWREYEDWTQYLSEEKRVPVVFGGEFDFDMLVKLSDGPSLIPNANHIREGIVVRPIPKRTHEHLGRSPLEVSWEFLFREVLESGGSYTGKGIRSRFRERSLWE